MLSAADSIADHHAALRVVLGLGVVLTFGALLLRTFAARLSGSRVAAAVAERLDASAGPRLSATAHMRLAGQLDSPGCGLAVIADVGEPESRRLTDDCLAPLARTLDGSRRLLAAEE